MVVVNENRALFKLRMQRVADATDVGAVAQGQQGKERLHGVFDGVYRAHVMKVVSAQLFFKMRVQLDPKADCLNVLDGRFERVLAEDDLVADANFLIGNYLRRDFQAA